MGSTKHFIHREHRPTDPEFLHEEREIPRTRSSTRYT